MKITCHALLIALLGLLAPQWLHASPFAYVSHRNGVSVVDVGTRSVITELPANAAQGVAVRPDLQRAYVADRDKITVIDIRSQAPIATAGYPTIGGLITMRPGTPEAYVITDHCSNTGGTCTPDLSKVIRVYNVDTNAVGNSFTDNATSSIGFSQDGLLMFVARGSPAQLAILNAANRQVIANIALASPPNGMAFDVARNLLYVAESGGTVAAIDVNTRSLLTRIAAGASPTALAIAGNRLFVTNNGSNNVTVIDLTTRAPVGTINVGAQPLGIDATPDGDQVVAVNNGSSTVTIIDVSSLNVVTTIGVGPSPVALGRFIVGSSAAVLPGALTGLWWNPAEPGWGVHVTHRGSKIFAAWFTYNASGFPKWYVSSDCTFNGEPPNGPDFTNQVTCSGNIYDTTGPRFFSDPFNASAVVVNKLGLFQMGFNDRNNGAMSVVIGNAVKTMTLKRQIFRAQDQLFPVDYTDLWWNPSESGWGLGITQQGNVMFLTWFVYDDTGTAMWYVASNCAVNASGNGCTGELYRTTGPLDPLRNTFDPSQVKVFAVGSITASFGDNNTGTISYTVDGKAGTKAITRQLF